MRKIGLLKKQAGTTWGDDTNILRRVYSTPNANKRKLDKFQNVALRAIVGAMKTTPIKEMEKRADLEPLELRRTFKVLTQMKKIRRLPGHPLHKKLAAPTKKSGSRPTVGFQEMKEQIAWLSLGANNCNPCPPPLTRKPKSCSETDENVNGKEPPETTTPLLTQSTVWQDMGRTLYSGCEKDTVACERT